MPNKTIEGKRMHKVSGRFVPVKGGTRPKTHSDSTKGNKKPKEKITATTGAAKSPKKKKKK